MIDQNTIDNILIRQKDHIIHLINEGQIMSALANLIVLKELWELECYEYKYIELLDRIELASQSLRDRTITALQPIAKENFTISTRDLPEIREDIYQHLPTIFPRKGVADAESSS